MILEEEAKKVFLDFINKDSRYPFIITSIELSDRKDYWIIASTTADTYPTPGGIYGFLLNRTNSEIITAGPEGPYSYLQDQYDLEDANGLNYVLKPNLEDSTKSTLLVKKVFKLNTSKSRLLTKSTTPWYAGTARHLRRTSELLAKKGITTSIHLTDKKEAYVDVKKYYWWVHEAIEDIQNEI